MKSKYYIFVLLVFATVLGGFLRFYKNTSNPPSLNQDEVSFGYSAYSILKTARDEHGKFLPLVFESIGDYKNPLQVYLIVLPIKFFGLNEFSVRFPNAFLGTLSIPIYFFFVLDILKNKKVAILGSLILSISAWHIFYSRFAYETLSASLFTLLGVWGFIKMLDGNKKWAVFSGFFFLLTMYTAFAPRLFVPIFLIVILIVKFKQLKKVLPTTLTFLTTCFILGLPLLYVTFFEKGDTRLSVVLISNDIEFSRYVLLNYFHDIRDIPFLLFFWVRRYLSYFQPDFLFFNGLDVTLPGSIGLGKLYLYELPWFILGIIDLAKRKIPHKDIFIVWLLTGAIPDSLTNNRTHFGRILHMFPVIILITTWGLIRFYEWLKSIPQKSVKIVLTSCYILFIIINLVHAFLIISVDFPREKGESFDEGLKQVALYIRDNQDKYNEIVVDPRRGVDGPYIVSNPFLYILFYLKYDPATYQSDPKIFSNPSYESFYHFGKYTTRKIDWTKDNKDKNTLLIASPWSFPENFDKSDKILKKIYLSNGELAFYIVTSK